MNSNEQFQPFNTKIHKDLILLLESYCMCIENTKEKRWHCFVKLEHQTNISIYMLTLEAIPCTNFPFQHQIEILFQKKLEIKKLCCELPGDNEVEFQSSIT